MHTGYVEVPNMRQVFIEYVKFIFGWNMPRLTCVSPMLINIVPNRIIFVVVFVY